MTASYVLTRHLDLIRSFGRIQTGGPSQGAPMFDGNFYNSPKSTCSFEFAILSIIRGLSRSAIRLYTDRKASCWLTDPTAMVVSAVQAIHITYYVLRLDLAAFLTYLSGLIRTTSPYMVLDRVFRTDRTRLTSVGVGTIRRVSAGRCTASKTSMKRNPLPPPPFRLENSQSSSTPHDCRHPEASG